MITHSRRWFFLSLIAILLLAALPACSGQATGNQKMISMDQMPSEVRAAPTTVQQAYQFAAAYPDTLKQIPCYCGCGAAGHTSNYSCYITGVDAKGTLTFDHHALGCSLCVDITQDVMRLQREGKGIQEIRAYVDSTYSKYGPSNMPAQ